MLSESSDQSGIVGFLVGIIVLVFVGIGFSLVVDKRFQFSNGKADLEETIAREKATLESLRHKAEIARGDYEEKSWPLLDQPAELEKLKQTVSASSRRLGELRGQQAGLKEAVEAEALSFAEYRATFRKQARQAAAGEKHPQLELAGGKIYRDITIRRVTPAGIEIAHSEGLSSVSAEDLGDEWHARFQWDAEESEAVAAVPEQPAKPPAQGSPRPEASAPVATLSPEKQAKQEQEKKLVFLRGEVAEAKLQLANARKELSRARANAGSNRAKSVPGSLETWDQRISRLEGASEMLRSKYITARAKLSAENPGDPLLRETLPSR